MKIPFCNDEKDRCDREQDQQDAKAFAEQLYDEEYERDMNSYGDGEDEPPKRGGKKVKGDPEPTPQPETTNNPQ